MSFQEADKLLSGRLCPEIHFGYHANKTETAHYIVSIRINSKENNLPILQGFDFISFG